MTFSRSFRLNLLGVVILISGLSSATSIWLAQDRMDRQTIGAGTNVTGPLSPEDSRRYSHDVEVYYGKTGLLMDNWGRWLAELTRGEPLAGMIAVASLIVAAGLFHVAAKSSKGARPHCSTFSRTPPPGASQISSPSKGPNAPL